MCKAFLVTVLFFLFPLAAFAQDDDAARKAYLEKRAAEKAESEEAVRELTARDPETMSADEHVRLCRAYNELGNNERALEAVCRVPDEVLAERKQLDLKAICFHNVNFGDDKSGRLRELAFIDRCLDRQWGNQGVWLWRKAKLVCQSAIAPAVPTRGDEIGSEERIIDREQYEYAFELLQRAFKSEPKLHDLAGVSHDFMWPSDFPMLHKEPRFQKLMKKMPADAAPAATPKP